MVSASVDFAGLIDYAFAVIQQTDGKLVLAGTSRTPNSEDIALARFNADGALDPTFGNGGKVTLDIGGSHDFARGLIQQPDGKLVIAGGAVSGHQLPFCVCAIQCRRNSRHDLRHRRHDAGRLWRRFRYSWADGLALQKDGKLVAVGRVGQYQPVRSDMSAIARLTTNGTLDPSFSGDGLLTIDVSGNSEQAFALAVQPDDAIVVAGSSRAGWWERAFQTLLLRVNRDGRLDNNFSCRTPVPI